MFPLPIGTGFVGWETGLQTTGFGRSFKHDFNLFQMNKVNTFVLMVDL